MRNITEDVGRNERLVIQAKVHWAHLIPLIIVTVLWEVICFGAFISDIVKLIRYDAYQPEGGSIVFGTILLMILGFINLLIGILQWRATQLLLTDKILYGRYGLFWTKNGYIPINKISYISVYKRIFAKLFGFGTIVVATSGGIFKFRGIKAPEEFRSMVLEQVKRFEGKD